MAPRRREHLRPLKRLRQLLTFFPRQQFLEARHVFLGLVLDVRVQVGEEGVEERKEIRGGGGEVLEFVEVFFYLGGVSLGCALETGAWELRLDAVDGRRWLGRGLPGPYASP